MSGPVALRRLLESHSFQGSQLLQATPTSAPHGRMEMIRKCIIMITLLKNVWNQHVFAFSSGPGLWQSAPSGGDMYIWLGIMWFTLRTHMHSHQNPTLGACTCCRLNTGEYSMAQCPPKLSQVMLQLQTPNCEIALCMLCNAQTSLKCNTLI